MSAFRWGIAPLGVVSEGQTKIQNGADGTSTLLSSTRLPEPWSGPIDPVGTNVSFVNTSHFFSLVVASF